VRGARSARITVPTRCVVASGSSFGSKGDEQERIRASLNQVVSPNLHNKNVNPRFGWNHSKVLHSQLASMPPR
jgi:hypothetical protein